MSFSENVSKKTFEVFGRPLKVADVGIELEVEGLNLPGTVPHWQAKPEGSLQNGIEYITKPIKEEVVAAYVDNLSKFITLSAGVVKPSYRCSTHIHVNVLGETLAEVLGYLVVFTMFEPLLLSLCGPNRDGNLFCLSSYDTGEAVSSFEKLCSTFHNITTHGWCYERGKYSAFNTGRLNDLGTLEARCFPLSMDGAEVYKWVRWLLAMKEMAKSETDKTYRSLWKQVRQSSGWYAYKIFGDAGLATPEYTALLDIGTETAYELTKVLKHYYSKPEKKEEVKPKRKGLFTELSSGVSTSAQEAQLSAWVSAANAPAPIAFYDPFVEMSPTSLATSQPPAGWNDIEETQF